MDSIMEWSVTILLASAAALSVLGVITAYRELF